MYVQLSQHIFLACKDNNGMPTLLLLAWAFNNVPFRYDNLCRSWLYPPSREYEWNMASEILKGIVQPFELGGETRLIRSAVKN